MSSDNHKTVDDGSRIEISGKPPSSQAECDVGLALNMQHTQSTYPSKKLNLMSHPSPYHHHPKYHQTSIEFGGGGRQIFEPSMTTSHHIAFANSPNYTNTTGGVIFTASQLQELESQTMIYKHIMSSIPVPPQLLFPNLSSQSNRSDSEPWRCRRTDGKKWRCSRDVMPDQRYCERHAHKNRPRSRKHVETQSQMQTQSHNTKHLSSKDNYNTTLPHTPTMSPSCQQSSLLMKSGTIPLSSSNQKIQKPMHTPSVGSKGDHFFQNLGGSHHDLVGDNCSLTLMQPGGNDNSDDQDLFQMGIGMLNADDSNTHNQWTHQGSWLGGPLGEALCLGVASSLNQPPNVTSSHDVGHGLH